MIRPGAIVILFCLTSTAYADSTEFESAASIYRSGDYAAALSRFMPLAESGDARAQTIVAMMYKYGEAVDQSWESAFDWYLKAAEAGYVPARFQVGEMYAEGLGVEQDRDEAIHWLRLAANGGLARANDKLKELEADVVPMEEGDRELIAWSNAWKLHLPHEMKRSPPAAPPVSRDAPATNVLYRVQLGAMKSEDAVRTLWSELAAASGDLFNGMQPIIRRRDLATGVLYALQTGPFPNLLAARRFCETMESLGIDSGCLPLQSSAAAE